MQLKVAGKFLYVKSLLVLKLSPIKTMESSMGYYTIKVPTFRNKFFIHQEFSSFIFSVS